MSSLISKKPLAEYGMQPYGPPCGMTISVQNVVRTIEQLDDKATSAVQMNGSIGEWFRTTVGVRQGHQNEKSPPSSTFFLNGPCLMAWKNMMGRLA